MIQAIARTVIDYIGQSDTNQFYSIYYSYLLTTGSYIIVPNPKLDIRHEKSHGFRPQLQFDEECCKWGVNTDGARRGESYTIYKKARHYYCDPNFLENVI